EEFTHSTYKEVKFKGDNGPFTYVDVTTEEILKKGCAAIIPGSGFITEETAAEKGENAYTWIIDPIDGTANFTHGIPHFCISIALRYEDEIMMGHIYQPVLDQMYMAIRGKGFYLDGKKKQVSQRKELREGILGTGFPYAHHSWVPDYLGLVADLHQSSHGFRRFGSAALDLAYVACGRLDGFFEFQLNAWDIAAGAIMVEEAGGKITDFKGGDGYLDKKGTIASNAYVHEDIQKAIAKRGFADRYKELEETKN
ncbi:MAG: inositol monophosphatase family protein, partial [Bacteroidota bacterium]